jgi:hypothetical protein
LTGLNHEEGFNHEGAKVTKDQNYYFVVETADSRRHEAAGRAGQVKADTV